MMIESCSKECCTIKDKQNNKSCKGKTIKDDDRELQ